MSAFQTWPLPDEPFDVVVAATAYHWLDPTVRVVKIAQALRPGGVLAVVETHHVAGDDEGLFVDVQDCYERWDPTTTPGLRLPTVIEVARTADTDHSGLFEKAVFRRYKWNQTYTCCKIEINYDPRFTHRVCRLQPSTPHRRGLAFRIDRDGPHGMEGWNRLLR